jgi:hypothetical protein
MSLDKLQVVDFVGTDIHTDEVVLSLLDEREWSDRGHLLALQTKINAYFAFIESGQLLEDYPAAKGRAVRIDVICRYEPDKEGVAFLAHALETAKGANWGMTWAVVSPNTSLEPAREG